MNRHLTSAETTKAVLITSSILEEFVIFEDELEDFRAPMIELRPEAATPERHEATSTSSWLKTHSRGVNTLLSTVWLPGQLSYDSAQDPRGKLYFNLPSLVNLPLYFV